jgi:hypothetical protein
MPNRHTFVYSEHSSFHLASRRTFAKRLMHDKGHIAPGRKADKGRFRLRSVPGIPLRQRCHDTIVNDLPGPADESWSRTRMCLRSKILDVRKSQNRNDSRSKLLVQPLRPKTTGYKHWPHVPRNLCSRAYQLRFDRPVWHTQDSGCLKD